MVVPRDRACKVDLERVVVQAVQRRQEVGSVAGRKARVVWVSDLLPVPHPPLIPIWVADTDIRRACAHRVRFDRVGHVGVDLGETGPLSQGVQVGRKALRIRHINGMKVCKKRPRGFK